MSVKQITVLPNPVNKPNRDLGSPLNYPRYAANLDFWQQAQQIVNNVASDILWTDPNNPAGVGCIDQRMSRWSTIFFDLREVSNNFFYNAVLYGSIDGLNWDALTTTEEFESTDGQLTYRVVGFKVGTGAHEFVVFHDQEYDFVDSKGNHTQVHSYLSYRFFKVQVATNQPNHNAFPVAQVIVYGR